MMNLDLRAAMDEYRRRYGRRLTYKSIAESSRIVARVVERIPKYRGRFQELKESSLEALATDPSRATSLRRVNTLCFLLVTTPDGLYRFKPERVEPFPILDKTAVRRLGNRSAGDAELAARPKLDPITNGVLREITKAGCTITVTGDGNTVRMVAKRADGVEHQVDGMDPFQSACDLAREVGIELTGK